MVEATIQFLSVSSHLATIVVAKPKSNEMSYCKTD